MIYWTTNLIIFLVVFSGALTKKAKMQLVVTGIDQCRGKDNLLIDIGHWQIIQQEKTQFYVTGTINFTRDFPNGFQVAIAIDKCQGDARLGNCDTFMSNFATKNVCFLFSLKKQQLVKVFLEAIEPQLNCPIKAGEYSVADLKVDESLIQYLPQLGATFWRILLSGSTDNTEIACAEISASVHSRRFRG